MSQKHILFKVVSVSDTTNSFGLRGHILVSRLGMAYEVGLSYLNVIPKDTVLKVPVTRADLRNHDTLQGALVRKTQCEIPRLLATKMPQAVLREVWGQPNAFRVGFEAAGKDPKSTNLPATPKVRRPRPKKQTAKA